jgi:hypothetical protein
MAKKTKSKTPPKHSSGAASSPRASERPNDRIDPYKKLLCRVAGNVAGALVGAPSPSISSADKIAAVAVDIAEQILKKVGVVAPSTAEASPATSTAAPGEAAL